METKDYIKEINPRAERRFATEGIRMKAATSTEPAVFRGYFLKFNTLSNDLGGFKERIAPGFLDSVLANDVRVLKNHDPHYILGRTINGTAKIGVDEIGGWYEYTDPNTSYSRDLAISIERGDISQSSFAFSLAGEGGDVWEKQQDGGYIRTLLKADTLYDASPVTYPAYEDTSVASRTLKALQIPEGIEEASELIEMEERIRDIQMQKRFYSIK
jgi:HK97 family phage prohead protease